MAAFGDSKVIGNQSLEMTKGGSRSEGTGPTGSSRSYPKGKSAPSSTQDAPFNPQKQAASTIYVGGVG